MISLTAGAQPTNQNVRLLGLQECQEMALAHNLDVQIERYSPQIARLALRASYGAFDPVLTLSASRTFFKQPATFEEQKLDQTNPTLTQNYTTNVFGHDFVFEQTVDSFGPALNGRLPNGLAYSFFARSDHFQGVSLPDAAFLLPLKSPVPPFLLPPSTNTPSSNNYVSTLGVTLTQPLLKDSWIDLSRRNIKLNKKNARLSELAFRAGLMSNVTTVATAYYNLLFAQEQVKVETSALESAQRLLEDTRRKVQAGALPPLDQQQAEANVETTQADLFAAEQAHAEEENALKDLLTDDYQAWMDVTIVPSENLTTVAELPANRVASWVNALTRRPDILQLQVELEKQDILLTFTYNQLFPTFNLLGGYGWQAIEHTFSQSLSGIRDGTSPNYSVGAVFAIPVANTTARNTYKATRLTRQQAFLRFKSLEQSVIAEVDTGVKLTETTFKQISSSRQAREFAQAALDSVQKQYDAGTLTSFFVVDAQRRLTQARSVEVRALADYNIAQAQLALSEGIALERNGIRITHE